MYLYRGNTVVFLFRLHVDLHDMFKGTCCFMCGGFWYSLRPYCSVRVRVQTCNMDVLTREDHSSTIRWLHLVYMCFWGCLFYALSFVHRNKLHITPSHTHKLVSHSLIACYIHTKGIGWLVCMLCHFHVFLSSFMGIFRKLLGNFLKNKK